MSNFIHIVFGDSAKGNLRYFFKNISSNFKGEVISLRDYYTIGPIYQIDTPEGKKDRIEWIESFFKYISFDEILGGKEYLKQMKEDILNIPNLIENIPLDSKVVIWHAKNSFDEIGLRYLMYLLKNEELYEVNVSDSFINCENGVQYRPISLSECNVDTIFSLIDKIKKIEISRKNKLIEDWNFIRNTKENLRIIYRNRIGGVKESYFDRQILSNCTFQFQKCAKIIGVTLGESDQLVSDTYVEYRIRKLIENEQLEYSGKLFTMRDYDIKLK